MIWKSIVILTLLSVSMAGNFTIVGDSYYLNGEPIQLISAEFQYYRTHPSRWEDTFKKIANAGMNAIQTYIAWNLHEPRKGEYRFDGIRDIERFFDLAKKYNLLVTLRPGPFICDEWDFGALPYWLLKEDGILIRSSDPRYMNHVRDWFNVLFPILSPHFIMNGGNIIMTQIENEYGSYYTCDMDYLNELYDITVQHLGPAEQYVIFTTDGPLDRMLQCGHLPEKTHATVDFGSVIEDVDKSFAMLRKYQPTGPLQNTEFYDGWIDHWNEPHSKLDYKLTIETMEKLYKIGASFNFYVFSGGTNWGFYSGANADRRNTYNPQPTSYDFDAPLTEYGYMTEKYYKIRDKIGEWKKLPHYPIDNYPVADYGEIEFVETAPLWKNLDRLDPSPVSATRVMTFENLDVDFGFVVYRTVLSGGGKLRLEKVHDRAYVFVNGKYFGLIDRLTLEVVKVVASKGDVLDLLVENQGRINHGYDMFDPKGIFGNVYMNNVLLFDWKMYRLRMDDLSNLQWEKTEKVEGPAFYRAVKKIENPVDTFINPKGWTKGHIYVNRLNIGRYWTIGPQLTLYCPAPLLKEGENEFIVFEHLTADRNTMTLDDKHQIDII